MKLAYSPNEETNGAEEPFQWRADHWHPQGALGLNRRQGSLPKAWHRRWHVLQVVLGVWRHGGVGCQAAEGARSRKREAEENARGAHAGRGHAQGVAVNGSRRMLCVRESLRTLLKPGARRKAGLSLSGGPVSVLVHFGSWRYSWGGRRSGSGWRRRPLDGFGSWRAIPQ